MTEFELPATLVQAVAGDLARGDDDRRPWLAGLPSMVAALADRWSLTVGRPFQPGGNVAWVAPASRESGEQVVLKVGWRHDEGAFEAAGLQAWDGRGAVRLLEVHETNDTTALLLEACEPGDTLSTLEPLEQDLVAGRTLQRLWIEPAVGHPFPTLTSMCRGWADGFDRTYAALDPGQRLDPGLARAGIEAFRELPTTADRTVLLCTDLHPGNILAAQREPWLMIDPKPHVGDPTYDGLQYMLNFPERLQADAPGFVARMADVLGLDRARLQLWLFARCVQESPDWPDLAATAIALAP